MAAIRFGPWQVLAAEGGGTVALAGERLAACGQAHLVVWQGLLRLGAADAPWPAPGRPRFAGERVCWGPGVLDLACGAYAPLYAAEPELRPGGGERPCVHAWSAHGERLLVGYATGDAQAPTRLVLFDGGRGEPLATLRHPAEFPPQAAWVGRTALVVGFGDPRAFAVDTGAECACIALGAGTVTRLDADAAERRLLAVDLNRCVAWIDPHAWQLVDRWEGRWLDAAIAPDGRHAVALDLAGGLHLARLAADRFEPLGAAAAPPFVATSVALDDTAIALAGGGLAARADYVIEESAA